MSRSLSKRSEVMPIRGSPNGARHCPPHLPQPGRDRSEQVDAINRNDWAPSIGNSGRHQSVRPPKDLPRAIRYLEDRELDWLLRVATEEAKRRGRAMPMAEASPTNTLAASSEPIPKQTKPPGRQTRQRQIRPAAAALTKGQVNAVRAAFKAGVTPSRIARQFGLSQSDVRKALSSD